MAPIGLSKGICTHSRPRYGLNMPFYVECPSTLSEVAKRVNYGFEGIQNVPKGVESCSVPESRYPHSLSHPVVVPLHVPVRRHTLPDMYPTRGYQHIQVYPYSRVSGEVWYRYEVGYELTSSLRGLNACLGYLLLKEVPAVP